MCPSRSPRQHRFFQAIAHSPEFAKKVGVAQSVGQDFEAADKAEGKYQRRDGGHIPMGSRIMATVDLRDQRTKARELARDNRATPEGLVRIADNQNGIADDLGDRNPVADGLKHHAPGIIDPHGQLQDGHEPRGKSGAESKNKAGRRKVEDPAQHLARPGKLGDDDRYANAGLTYDIRRDGGGQ